MKQIKQIALNTLRFLGISLLIDLGILALVTLSLLIWPTNNAGYSERMFWSAFAAIIGGMPAVLAGLSTSQGYYNSPFTAGQDAKVALTIVEDGRRGLSGRARYAWRMFSIGIMGIGIAALIDILG